MLLITLNITNNSPEYLKLQICNDILTYLHHTQVPSENGTNTILTRLSIGLLKESIFHNTTTYF